MRLCLTIGLLLLGLGTLTVGVNVYISFVRYPMHRLRGGTGEDFRWVSGFPLAGSLCLGIATIFLSVKPALAWLAAAICLFDTGGPHWLLGTMVYMLLFRGRTRNG